MPIPKADTELMLQGRALGHPTRHHIFRYLADARHAVGVAEFTASVQLNHNAVRHHLTVLLDAGLALEEVEDRDRPDRPRLLYRIVPEVEGSWGMSGPLELLAQALAEVISTNSSPYEVGQRLGRERAIHLIPELGQAEPDQLLEDETSRWGFRATAKPGTPILELAVHRCPFASMAERSPQVVCELHRGLIDGLCGGLGGLKMIEFTPRRKQDKACRIAARMGNR